MVLSGMIVNHLSFHTGDGADTGGSIADAPYVMALLSHDRAHFRFC